MGDLDEDTMTEMLNEVMADGGSQAQSAMDACQKGMDIVGQRFESGEYFVGDLIYAGELMTTAVEILKSALVAGESKDGEAKKMILCTVKDDLHDIGKNIVRSMLEAAGFEVIDLGIDVPAEKVVETVKAENLKIVALSGVLTLAIDSMKKTVDALKAAGLSDVKVIIGESHEDHRRGRVGAQSAEDRLRLPGMEQGGLSPCFATNTKIGGDCFDSTGIGKIPTETHP